MDGRVSFGVVELIFQSVRSEAICRCFSKSIFNNLDFAISIRIFQVYLYDGDFSGGFDTSEFTPAKGVGVLALAWSPTTEDHVLATVDLGS